MKRFRTQYFLMLMVVFCSAQPPPSWSQLLPQPSGGFSIGHQRFEWTDSSRSEVLAIPNTRRRIVAEAWYPAENNRGATIPYVDTSAINNALGKQGLQSFIGIEADALINAGKVHTHAHKDAAFARTLPSSPVIFFSHGMGMITQLYTTQIEDLVSHGYIVIALTHPYDAWFVSFADNTQLLFETQQRSATGKTEEQLAGYENKRIEVWAEDIRFALDRLTVINRTKTDSIPMAGHMDLARVGALGHSSGGRAAARACQLDARIRSCADQDGVAMMQPFYPGPDGVGMKQAFLLFERARNVTLHETDAADVGMSLSKLNTLVKSLRRKKETALAATGGSYHVLLHFDSSSHMSFSDLPLLQAKNDTEAASASRVLQVTCRYTREFFDKTLRQMTSPLYDNSIRMQYIDMVKSYPKATKVK
jgi:hypothetical protein